MTHLRHELVGSVSKAEMLYKTNLVAMVGGGKKPRFPDNVVMVYDDRQQEFVLELSLPESVLSVRLKRDKLVAVCRSEIHVFSFPNRCQNLFKVTTRDNPRGLCELSSIRSGAVETSIGNILFFFSFYTQCPNWPITLSLKSFVSYISKKYLTTNDP